MEQFIEEFVREEKLEVVEHGDFIVGVGTLMTLLEKDRAEQLKLHLVIKSDTATKYAELRQKCEDVVYGDPDGETDQTEMIAEIVCEEFEIM